jgi:hypothetical protein
VSIDVWPAIDASTSVRFEQRYGNGNLATVVVTAKHGRAPATGIAYQATLSPAADVLIVGVRPGTSEIQPPGLDSSTATWGAYKFAAFTSQIYRLVLEAKQPKMIKNGNSRIEHYGGCRSEKFRHRYALVL